MKNKFSTVIVIGFSILLVCCKREEKKEPVWTELPSVTRLESLSQTAFVPTLESPIDSNKNIVYAPTLLYAWEKIRQELKRPVTISSSNSMNFFLLSQSTTYQGALVDTEYTASAEIVNGQIIARAFFNKTLPFPTKLQTAEQPLLFSGTKVAAFGMYHFDKEAIKFSQVVYYKNDDDFILKLVPKDKQHEIVLVKGLAGYTTLKDALELTNEKIKRGIEEQQSGQHAWKYWIDHEDIFSVPTIKFNIATNYKDLLGQVFSTLDNNNNNFTITEAYQRTGFILNENGAVVESEAVAKVDSSKAMVDNPHPKRMLFDKEFLIIIKRTGQPNPYLVVKVNNTELLKKE
jgi:hypothetical protein